MKYLKLTSFFAVLPMLFTSTAGAADINFSGFTTISAGTTTASDESYADYTNELDFNQGSLFALQVSSQLDDGLSVTAQLIARGKDDWEPAFEWAFLAYEINDNLRFLVGRQRAPFFYYSDYLDVSYAYHWIAPPLGVYSLPFDSFDGVSAIYNIQFGEVDNSFHFILGRNTDTITRENGLKVKPEFNNMLGLAWTLNKDWLTLRAAYFQTKMTLNIPELKGLVQGWNNAGYNDIANNMIAKKDKVNFSELGFQIDYNDFFVVGEYTYLDLNNTGGAVEDSYYISVGKRFDTVMVHFTYGQDENKMDYLLDDLPTNSPAIARLHEMTVTNLIDVQTAESKYIKIGANWNFHEVATLKFEVTNFENELDSRDDATLLNVALVTVF